MDPHSRTREYAPGESAVRVSTLASTSGNGAAQKKCASASTANSQAKRLSSHSPAKLMAAASVVSRISFCR